ncbi:unnamed protein product [Anisakis simplex]|uniref:Chitinase n=1 Tax=Anisakis simplex TaxID=6269 RepID=A0A0M3K6E2_ANISI|nr:unnamed protein product [Anisakis simplex]
MRARGVVIIVALLSQLSHIDAGKPNCPDVRKYGSGPPQSCTPPSDPNNKSPSKLEEWFTKEMFEDLFPYANIGWGPNKCWPYSYEAFVIAARYFPRFGTSSPNSVYTPEENTRRDVAAFFAHAIQETGANDASVYTGRSKEEADDCFYRGGLYNWFEGGPVSGFLDSASPGSKPEDGKKCNAAGRLGIRQSQSLNVHLIQLDEARTHAGVPSYSSYCVQSPQIDYFFSCDGSDKTADGFYTDCYFGRGAIQISYNYNYGQFGQWLRANGIDVDLLAEPNLVMTKMDPPLALLASLWFYMTPQPPKPAMHDIVLGDWTAGSVNEAAGYSGPIFGPTSLIINNECNGEDEGEPGGPGESRRIKAFKWFCKYFNVPAGKDEELTCKSMPQKLDQIQHNLSYQPDWSSSWKEEPCKCAPASYAGMIPYFDANYYPKEFVALNEDNQKRCVESVYGNPSMYSMDSSSSACLKHPQN